MTVSYCAGTCDAECAASSDFVMAMKTVQHVQIVSARRTWL